MHRKLRRGRFCYRSRPARLGAKVCLYLAKDLPESFKTILRLSPNVAVFAPMEAVFDTAINVSDFRRRASGDSDQWVLTTAPLKRYLHHLTRPENIKFSSYASIRTLIPAFSITASLDTYHGQMITDGSRAMDLVHFLRTAHYAQPIDSRIVMSIRILLSFLCDVQIRSYSWGNDESITKDDATVVDLSFSNEQGFIYHRMRCDGWCPFQLSRMFTMLNSCALYFMSHVEPPDPFTKHHTIRIWPQSDLPSSNSTGQTDRENIYWTGDICTRTKCVAIHLMTARTRQNMSKGVKVVMM